MKNRKPKFFYGYVVVLGAVLIMMMQGGTRFSFGVFFMPLLTEFGWTRAMTSSAFSLSMLVVGLLGIGMGRLNDRFGPRLVVTLCGFFLGLGYLLMSQLSAIWQLYLFYGVIIGIGTSGLRVPVLSTVARWFVKRRGVLTGIVLAGIGAGQMIMPPVANWLISTYGWRTSFAIMGILVLVFIILAAQFLRRDPDKMGLLPYGGEDVKAQSLDLPAGGLSLRKAVQTSQFWVLSAVSFCNGFGFSAIWVHIVPHAIELGITATNAATILVVMGGVSIAGRLIIGSASDRIGYKPAYIICFTLTSMALFWLVVAKELWMLYLVGAIFSFGGGGLGVLGSLMVAQLFGLSSHGVILAVIGLGWTSGAAIGPALAGYIFDISGRYQLAFLISAAISIIGLILILLLRPASGKGEINDSTRGTQLC